MYTEEGLHVGRACTCTQGPVPMKCHRGHIFGYRKPLNVSVCMEITEYLCEKTGQ